LKAEPVECGGIGAASVVTSPDVLPARVYPGGAKSLHVTPRLHPSQLVATDFCLHMGQTMWL